MRAEFKSVHRGPMPVSPVPCIEIETESATHEPLRDWLLASGFDVQEGCPDWGTSWVRVFPPEEQPCDS